MFYVQAIPTWNLQALIHTIAPSAPGKLSLRTTLVGTNISFPEKVGTKGQLPPQSVLGKAWVKLGVKFKWTLCGRGGAYSPNGCLASVSSPVISHQGWDGDATCSG